MLIPSFEDIKKVKNSKYKLAIMVAQRARQLNDGADTLIDDDSENNNVTLAMKESLDGKIKGE